MPLTTRVRTAFRDTIRQRGDAYAHGGRVRVATSSDDRANARVRGSAGSSYGVAIRVIGRGRSAALGVACSCPYFNGPEYDPGVGDFCKHLWATLVVLDEQGWNPAAFERSGRTPIRLVELTEDDSESDAIDADDEAESESDDEFDDYRATPKRTAETRVSARPRLAAAPALDAKRPGKGRLRGWRSRLDDLAANPFGPRSALRMAPLLYLIDPREARDTQQVRVHFARRQSRRDGTPGALLSARISVADIGAAASRAESSALVQLLTIAQTEAVLGRGAYGYSYAIDPRRIVTAAVTVPTALLDPVLPRLAATGRLALVPEGKVFGTGAQLDPLPLRLDEGPAWQFRLEIGADPAGGYALRGCFARAGASLAIEAITLILAGDFLIEGDRLARADVDSVAAVAELRHGPLRIPARDLDTAVEQLAAVPELAAIEMASAVPWAERAGSSVPRLRFDAASDEARQVEAQLDFGYGEVFVESGFAGARVADRATHTLFERDLAAEASAVGTLRSLGFRPAPHGHDVDPTHLVLPASAFERAAHELLAKGWILEVDGARLRSAGRSSATVRSGVDFFDLSGGVDFDGTAVPFPALLAALQNGSRFVRLGDGSRGLLPRTWLDRCAGLAGCAEIGADGLRFRRAQAGILDALLEAQDEARVDRRFAAIRKKLARFDGIAPVDAPAAFRGTLREYQREGLGWLHFLRDFEFGGCLADDMGLGKTVQVLALLAGRATGRRGGKRAPRTSLVVAPRSVVHGWIDEAARFAPALRVLRYDGSDRAALRSRFDEHDLVVDELRNAAARHRTPRSAGLRLRDPRRSADDQERGVADRARREDAARGPSAGAHRDADREPPGRVGVAARVPESRPARPRARASRR